MSTWSLRAVGDEVFDWYIEKATKTVLYSMLFGFTSGVRSLRHVSPMHRRLDRYPVSRRVLNLRHVVEEAVRRLGQRLRFQETMPTG